MSNRKESAGVLIGRSICMGSLLLAGLAHAQAEPVIGVGTQAVETMQPMVKVIAANGADASDIKPLLESEIAKLGTPPRTLDDVNRWSDVLTAALRQGGYPIGQVLMTEEDWQAAARGAQPQFTVIPGRISKITLKNTSRVNDARLERLIKNAMCKGDPIDGTCLLRTSRLERTTQLLQDVPGVAIEKAPELSPGAGMGDVEVTFYIGKLGKAASADVVVDNKGIQSTGAVRFGVTAAANNVFGMGEDYAMTVMDTNKNMWTGSLTGSVPLFDNGLRATAGFTRQQYSINTVTAMTGVSNTVQAGVSYPFTRGLDRNVWGGMSYLHSTSGTTYKDYDNFKDTSQLDAVQLSLRADNGDRARQLRTDMWSAQTALTLGHERNNSSADSITHVSGDYAKLAGSAFGTYGLTKSGNLFMTARINAQVPNRNLDPSEKLNVGGPDAVRAYRTDEGSFDEGAVLNFGIYQRVPVATGHQLQFGVFSDFARGRVNHSPWEGWENTYVNVPGVKNTRTLAGYGVSVDWLTPIGATVSASVAKPYGFSSTSWAEPGKKPTQFWLSVTFAH